MNPVHRIADLPALLELPGVVEELELGSALGVCALHGGGLERATEVVAREVADRTGASYYGVIQPEGTRHHLSSTRFDPDASPRLATFLERIQTIVSIHGYGRDDDFFAVLLGGTNRPFAHHLAGHLRGTLPDDYRVVDDSRRCRAGFAASTPATPSTGHDTVAYRSNSHRASDGTSTPTTGATGTAHPGHRNSTT